MIEQIISLETAKLAKEKKFREEVFSYYNCNKTGIYGKSAFNSFDYLEQDQDDWNGDGYLTTISAPTQSLLQKWLREVHNIQIYVSIFYQHDWEQEYSYQYTYIENKESWNGIKHYKTYEEALENGLMEGLKLVKI